MTDAAELKSCCAAAYQSDLARVLLGDSFHPGGLELTSRLSGLLALGPGDELLDVAAGRGESAIFLAQKLGCRVTGIDLGAGNIVEAKARAEAAGVANLVQFEHGDAERTDFPDASFDAVLCECAFCTFPDKRAAVGEFHRVLRPGGRIGLSDPTRSGDLPAELSGLLAWIACIGDAQPVGQYISQLDAGGFEAVLAEAHDDSLRQMVREIQGRLLAAELMVKLEKLDLGGVNFEEAKAMARCGADAVRAHLLGYSLITARKAVCR
jgi:arsenite methyltransferase